MEALITAKNHTIAGLKRDNWRLIREKIGLLVDLADYKVPHRERAFLYSKLEQEHQMLLTHY